MQQKNIGSQAINIDDYLTTTTTQIPGSIWFNPNLAKTGKSLQFRSVSLPPISAGSFPPSPSFGQQLTQQFSISLWIYVSSPTNDTIPFYSNDYSGYILLSQVSDRYQEQVNSRGVMPSMTVYLGNSCPETIFAIDNAASCLYLSFSLVLSDGSNFTLNTSTSSSTNGGGRGGGVMKAEEWIHVVCTYSSSGPEIWVDGILAATTARNTNIPLLTINGRPVVENENENENENDDNYLNKSLSWTTYSYNSAEYYWIFVTDAVILPYNNTFRYLSLDELRFYPEALDENQIHYIYTADIYTITPLQVQIVSPQPNFTIIPVLNNTIFAAAVTTSTDAANNIQDDLRSQWSLLSTTAQKCGNLVFSNQYALNTSVAWGQTIGGYTLDICVTGGNSYGRTNITVDVVNQMPQIISQPSDQTLSIGSTLQIDGLSINAYPPAQYRWQKGIKVHQQQRQSVLISSNVTILDDNETEIIWEDTNQTTSIYYGGIVDQSDDSTYYRVRITSSIDTVGVYSEPVRVSVIPLVIQQSSANNIIGKIVGGVLGGVLGICCSLLLCSLCLLLVVFKAGLLRKRKGTKKLLSPDYEVLTYGNYTDPIYIRRTIDPQGGLATFESLLLQERGSKSKYVIPLAIAQSEEVNQECIKSLVWLFQKS